VSNALLRGRKWVPSPHGARAVGKATASIGPCALTEEVDATYASASSHVTIAVPPSRGGIIARKDLGIVMVNSSAVDNVTRHARRPYGALGECRLGAAAPMSRHRASLTFSCKYSGRGDTG
jgi:hypothetical protein